MAVQTTIIVYLELKVKLNKTSAFSRKSTIYISRCVSCERREGNTRILMSNEALTQVFSGILAD